MAASRLLLLLTRSGERVISLRRRRRSGQRAAATMDAAFRSLGDVDKKTLAAAAQIGASLLRVVVAAAADRTLFVRIRASCIVSLVLR